MFSSKNFNSKIKKLKEQSAVIDVQKEKIRQEYQEKINALFRERDAKLDALQKAQAEITYQIVKEKVQINVSAAESEKATSSEQSLKIIITK